MSAYVVDKTHIDLLVDALIRYFAVDELHDMVDDRCETGIALLDRLGETLVEQNVRSVLHRYRDDRSMVPEYAQRYRYAPVLVVPTPVELLKAIACYEYQSCETDDWESTRAYRMMERLKLRIIIHLPGYEEAPWEWTEETVKARIQARSRVI